MTAMQSRMEPEHPAAGRTEAAAAVEPRSRVNPMMWLLIASELAVFGAALLGYAFARAKDPSGFLAAQNELDRFAGAVNTVALLTSGLLAALAVEARAAGLRSRARQLLAGAGALGVVFLAVKAQEYAVEIGNGHGLDDGGFVTLYFLIPASMPPMSFWGSSFSASSRGGTTSTTSRPEPPSGTWSISSG
jgi:heme/copper-type cytochrome/quinol oxidase subunit 3